LSLAPSHLLAIRLDRLRAAVASAACDALVVSRLPNLFYLTNFAGSAGLALVTPTDLFLVVDSRYLMDASDLLASAAGPPGATVVPVDGSYDETLLSILDSEGVRGPGFEAEDVSFARYEWLRGRLPGGVALRPTRRLVERLREVKDTHEIEALRRAARALSSIVSPIVGQVAPGRSERDVAGAIEAALRSSGFSRPAFDTIVGSGPNSARPHATAGDRAIGRGDLVVLDFGGVMEGYCVDLTRTVSVGPADREVRRVYEAVAAAQQAAIDAVRPGAPAWEIDRAARDVLERAGLGEAFGHGTGHGLGIEVHEDPRITRRRSGVPGTAGEPAPWATVLAPGMVFTVEPGAYLPGWGGVRIEDDVLVTETGCEVLTDAPRGLFEL
jgi:Xaa-Pro aminopeptidase